MNQQRPRIKKARKEPTREKVSRDPPQVAVPWGRGASEYRPGLFTLRYLMEHEEGCVADIYYELSREIERLNAERIPIGEKPIRRPNYSSYAKYFHWFKLMRLVEATDKREPAVYDFLEERVFYRLTTKGTAERRPWEAPRQVAHPQS